MSESPSPSGPPLSGPQQPYGAQPQAHHHDAVGQHFGGGSRSFGKFLVVIVGVPANFRR